jgi:hypothetical protein
MTIQQLLKNLAAATTQAEIEAANLAVANYVRDRGPGIVVNKDGTATLYTPIYDYGTPMFLTTNYPVWVIH